jgi:hypothetical protein
MPIVTGLDQHRALITAEWIDTTTGEIARARIAPTRSSRRSAISAAEIIMTACVPQQKRATARWRPHGGSSAARAAV